MRLHFNRNKIYEGFKNNNNYGNINNINNNYKGRNNYNNMLENAKNNIN
jgi:hypothetical protein